MIIDELVRSRIELNNDILKYLCDEIDSIKYAADNMCECATNIKGQGYALFMRSREDFLEKINNLQKNLKITTNIVINKELAN